MMMMSKGDSAEFIVPADSFFLKSMQYNELPKGINPGDKVRALFKIKDIMPAKEVEAERKKQMEEQAAQMKEMEEKTFAVINRANQNEPRSMVSQEKRLLLKRNQRKRSRRIMERSKPLQFPKNSQNLVKFPKKNPRVKRRNQRRQLKGE